MTRPSESAYNVKTAAPHFALDGPQILKLLWTIDGHEPQWQAHPPPQQPPPPPVDPPDALEVDPLPEPFAALKTES
jgi:hypothetical protein